MERSAAGRSALARPGDRSAAHHLDAGGGRAQQGSRALYGSSPGPGYRWQAAGGAARLDQRATQTRLRSAERRAERTMSKHEAPDETNWISGADSQTAGPVWHIVCVPHNTAAGSRLHSAESQGTSAPILPDKMVLFPRPRVTREASERPNSVHPKLSFIENFSVHMY